MENDKCPIGPKRLVTQSNALVTSAYKLRIVAMKLLKVLIGMVNPFDITQQGQIEFTLNDLDEATFYPGVLPKYRTRYVNELLKAIGSTPLEIKDEMTGKWVVMWWFSKIEAPFYHKGTFQAVFNTNVLNFLYSLKRNYITYEIDAITNLTSYFSIRLFEIAIMLNTSQGGVGNIIPIKVFTRMFSTKKKNPYIKKPAEFIADYIRSAIAELKKESDIDLELKIYKEQRVITAVQFIIRKPKEIEMKNESAAPTGDEEVVAEENLPDDLTAMFQIFEKAMGNTKSERKKKRKTKTKARVNPDNVKSEALITRIKNTLKENKIPTWDTNTPKMIQQLKQVVKFVSEIKFGFNEVMAENFLVWTIKQMDEIELMIPGVFRIKGVWNPYTIKHILNTNKDTELLVMTFNKGENIVF